MRDTMLIAVASVLLAEGISLAFGRAVAVGFCVGGLLAIVLCLWEIGASTNRKPRP